MNDDEKIYGLMAQANDLQSAVQDAANAFSKTMQSIQKTAQSTLSALPNVCKEAIETEASRIIEAATKKAFSGVLEAAENARAVSKAMRTTWYLHGLFLILAALVVAVVGYGLAGMVIKNRMNTLAELKSQIAIERATLNKLQSETWNLELVTYGDGTRGIILPKGVKFSHSGLLNDGSNRTGIVIFP